MSLKPGTSLLRILLRNPIPLALRAEAIDYFLVILIMGIEIKKKDIEKKSGEFSTKISDDRKTRLSKFFGVLKLKEDAVTLQRRWRDGVKTYVFKTS